MAKVVAMGGGENELLFRYALGMTGKAANRFLFVGTASGDKEDYYERVAGMMRGMGCETKPLFLIREQYTDEELDALLEWTDVLYVCGGDTWKMMKIWRERGLDRRLRQLHREGRVVLTGSSAGGICWFATGYSDSSRTPLKEGCPHGWVDGLGIYPQAFCPHFASRKDGFAEALRPTGLDALALEDHTAFVDDGGKTCFVRCGEEREVLLFRNTPEGVTAQIPEVVTLGTQKSE